MSRFKVGDLVECIDDGGYVTIQKGWIYKIEKFYGGNLLIVSNGNGLINDQFYPHRFKLAEPSLKVGDKVRRKNVVGIWEFVQKTDSVSFVKSESGVLYAVEHSSLEKVEEKTAPPKFTKVYVWDGKERPEYPVQKYFYGFLSGDLISVCAETENGCIDCRGSRWENWEVIG